MRTLQISPVVRRTPLRRLTVALRATTALIGVATVVAAMSIFASAPALASGLGGAGGSGDLSTVVSGGGGSGGGGANGNGQTGGTGSGAATGGAGGTSPGANGASGTGDPGGGGGGGGGASGADLIIGILDNTGAVTGNAGGNGGAGASTSGGGGGGGGGGDIVVTGTGTMTNSGTLTGGAAGSGGTGDSSGSGSPGGNGAAGNGGSGLIFTMGGVVFTNTASGTVTGGAGATGGAGIVASATMTIVNAGAISRGAGPGGPGSNDYGIYALLGTLTLSNSGTISGSTGIHVAGDALVLTNTGTVSGAGDGSYGIFSTGTVGITNSGTISASGLNAVGVASTGLATIVNSGTISANDNGIRAGAGGSVTNTGTIQGSLNGIVSNGAIDVSNAGAITSGSVGVSSNAGGTITNAATGSIRGDSSAAIENYNGLLTVTNSGAITSSVDAIRISSSGGGLVVTNNAGNGVTSLIRGDQNGINASYSPDPVTVTNSGAIIGTTGDGITANGALTLTNNAGDGVTTGLISGAGYGVMNVNGDATITNAGTITGGSVGIQTSGTAAISNTGTIQSNYSGIISYGLSSVFNDGTITGTGVTAIYFGAAGSTLTLGTHSVINGTVYGGPNGTLQLGGTGSATFDVGAIGLFGSSAQYQTFTTFNKVGDSTWALTGTPGQATSWNINGGTLSVSSDSNLGSGNEDLSFNGGILQVTGTAFTATTRNIHWGASGGGFDIADANNIFDLSSALSGAGGLTKLGAGTLRISGITDYSGATKIMAGTLQASPNNASLSMNSDFTIAAGAILDLNESFQLIGSLSGAGTVTNSSANAAILAVGGNSVNTTFSGKIVDGGSGGAGAVALWVGTAGTTGTFTLTGNDNAYSGGTVICSCWTLQLGDGGTSGAITGDIENGGTLVFNRSNGLTLGGNISDGSGAGKVVQLGSGVTTLTGINTYTGGTTITAGTLSVGAEANLGALAGGLTLNGGTLQVTGTRFTSTARSIIWGVNGGGFDIADAANTFTLSQTLSGPGGLTKLGAGTLVLSAVNSYTGATTISGGTLRQGVAGALGTAGAYMIAAGATFDLGSFNTAIASLSGAGALQLGSARLTVGSDNTSTTFAGAISGTGGLSKTGAGRLNLTGISTYSGATTLNAGTLSVNGSIANSAVTVNAGGTLGGNGTVGSTTFNGGTLSPGNSIGLLTVAGNLVLSAATTYMVEVSSEGSDRANVTGFANLGGARVAASFAPGSYVSKQYTILNAAGGLGGSTFNSVVSTNLPTNFNASLSYDTGNAYLDLKLDFGIPSPLNGNQTQVGNALTGYFDRTGGIPLAFAQLSAADLTQASGEAATGSQQATFTAMTQFMGAITDPFTAGRGFDAPEALGYAATRKPADAFALFNKAPPLAQAFEPRWSVWASGFGGSQTTNGGTVAGSNNARASIGGTAVGADVMLSPNTVAGFALAGAGTNFSVANGGSGHSDMFQAGAFIRHTQASSYITAAAAYGWQDLTTDRIVTVAGHDRLHAQFKANAYSARLEGGNRYVASWLGGIGVTPYAAAQVIAFDLPSYAESIVGGAGTFALNYSGKTVTSTRSEVGLRADKSFAVEDAILTLRGRTAWAHDYNTNRGIAATFQALPGASFTVNGAAPARNAALTTASAEISFVNGVSIAATFEGEFSEVTRSYAGKGVVRYAW